jgi:hypothetical protein
LPVQQGIRAEAGRNLRAQPVGVDDQFGEAALGQRLHRPLHQRLAAHFEQGLGCGVGQRPHALAAACGQDHRPHGSRGAHAAMRPRCSSLRSLCRGLEQRHQALHQRMRLGRMVAAEIADVHIERHAALLGPGVDAQVRFGQQHRGRHAARPLGVAGKEWTSLPTACSPAAVTALMQTAPSAGPSVSH